MQWTKLFGATTLTWHTINNEKIIINLCKSDRQLNTTTYDNCEEKKITVKE